MLSFPREPGGNPEIIKILDTGLRRYDDQCGYSPMSLAGIQKGIDIELDLPKGYHGPTNPFGDDILRTIRR